MTGWIVTWQDPVALGLAAAGLALALWLQRRAPKGGCHGCASSPAAARRRRPRAPGPAAPARVQLAGTRLGRRAASRPTG